MSKVEGWALAILFEPEGDKVVYKDLVKVQKELLEPSRFFPREQGETKESYDFFLKGHEALFGPEGLFPNALKINIKEIPKNIFPLTREKIDNAFHEQVKAFLREHGKTPPSEK